MKRLFFILLSFACAATNIFAMQELSKYVEAQAQIAAYLFDTTPPQFDAAIAHVQNLASRQILADDEAQQLLSFIRDQQDAIVGRAATPTPVRPFELIRERVEAALQADDAYTALSLIDEPCLSDEEIILLQTIIEHWFDAKDHASASTSGPSDEKEVAGSKVRADNIQELLSDLSRQFEVLESKVSGPIDKVAEEVVDVSDLRTRVQNLEPQLLAICKNKIERDRAIRTASDMEYRCAQLTDELTAKIRILIQGRLALAESVEDFEQIERLLSGYARSISSHTLQLLRGQLAIARHELDETLQKANATEVDVIAVQRQAQELFNQARTALFEGKSDDVKRLCDEIIKCISILNERDRVYFEDRIRAIQERSMKRA